MVLMQFLVAVLVSAIDPLLIVAYVGAALFSRNWRAAALYGPLAGMAMLIFLALLMGGGWQPKLFSVVAQLAACGLGAVLVRLLLDAIRSKPAAAS